MLFYDTTLGEDVLDLTEDYFYQLSESGVIQRPKPHVGFIYILDATQPYTPSDVSFEHAVLASRKINPDQWPEGKEYDKIAKAKARLAWREKMDTLKLVEDEPWRLRDGDVRFGGAIYI